MKRPQFILVLLSALVLISCGGTASSTKIDVTMTDFQFTPNLFTIPAGQEITVNAVNNGAVVHEFTIMKFGTTAGDKFGDEDKVNIFLQVKVDPGSSQSVTFTAPTDIGDYQIVCGTPGHLEAGMVGKLSVVAGK